jgi:2-methylaconitate cis-trans-isomerase PrpF
MLPEALELPVLIQFFQQSLQLVAVKVHLTLMDQQVVPAVVVVVLLEYLAQVALEQLIKVSLAVRTLLLELIHQAVAVAVELMIALVLTVVLELLFLDIQTPEQLLLVQV